MKKILVTLISLLLFSIPVYAQQNVMYKTDYDMVTKTASIYALFDNSGEKCIKILLLKAGSDFENIDEEDYIFNENVYHIDQIYTSEDFIKTSFKLDGGYGLYKGRINSDENEFSFCISGATDLKNSLITLNSDETAISNFLENDAKKINVYTYSKLSPDSKSKVIKSVGDKTFLIGNTDVEIISYAEEAKDFINAEIASRLLVDAQTVDEVKKLIKIYAEELNLNTEGTFKDLEEVDKNEVLAKLIGAEISNAQELRNMFNKNSAYKVIEKLPYAYAEEALKAFKTIDYTYYNMLSNKSTALKGISGKAYNSEEILKADFEKLCLDAYRAENRVNAPVGGGGSGGGGNKTGTGQRPTGYNPSADAEYSDVTAKFTDISEVLWAKEAIEALYSEGIISGRGNKLFAPDDFVTRAEFTKMLVMSTQVLSNTAKCSFNDAKEQDWFYEYVASAYENGFVEGDGDNKFNPDAHISREDIATMLYRAVRAKGNTLEKVSEYVQFDDYDLISDYAQEAIKELKSAGIINGMEDNTFKPKSNATRAQAAVMLWAYLNAIR